MYQQVKSMTIKWEKGKDFLFFAISQKMQILKDFLNKLKILTSFILCNTKDWIGSFWSIVITDVSLMYVNGILDSMCPCLIFSLLQKLDLSLQISSSESFWSMQDLDKHQLQDCVEMPLKGDLWCSLLGMDGCQVARLPEGVGHGEGLWGSV